LNLEIQTYFNYKEAYSSGLALNGLSVQDLEVLRNRAHNDLSVFVERFDFTKGVREISIHFNYDKYIFADDDIKMLAARWQQLIKQCIDRPDVPVGCLDILTPAERQTMLYDWNSTARDFQSMVPLHELFELQVRKHGDRPAILSEMGDLTYSELSRLSNDMARLIMEKGIGERQVVAIHMNRSPELIVAMLAVLKSGSAFLNIDPDLPSDRKKFMAEQVGAAIIISDIEDDDLYSILIDVIPLKNFHVPASPASESILHEKIADLSMPAYVIFTSGSTGKPKGVTIAHRSILNLVLHSQEMYGYGPDDRTLQKAALSFDVSIFEIFLPLVSGGAVVLCGPENLPLPEHLVELMVKFRVTDVEFVATMLSQLLQVEGVERLNTHLRTIRCGGESMDLHLMQRCHEVFTARIVHDYGPAEAAVTVCAWDCEPGYTQDPLPIGKPYANNRLYVLDQSGRPVPPGVIGELYIGGAQVGLGYIHQPELTLDYFVEDPFDLSGTSKLYRTGDLVKYLPDGNIVFVGRNDDQVKIRGQRVELEEVAAALRQCEGILAAVVLADKSNTGRLTLNAYIRTAPSIFQGIGLLADQLGKLIPRHMIPQYFHEVSVIPMTVHGKVDKTALRDMSKRTLQLEASFEPPADKLEQELAILWCEQLGLERVGRTDDYFTLGGHSLQLMRIMSSVKQQYGVEVDLRKFYRSSQLRDMALMIEEARSYPSKTDDALKIDPVPIWEETGTQHVYITIGGDGRMSGFTKYRKMGQWLGGPWKMYALPDPEASSGKVPAMPLEELAQKYAEAILRHQPEGPYILMGECIGGMDTFAIGCALQKLTDAEVRLFMLDTVAPDPEKDNTRHDLPKVFDPRTLFQTRESNQENSRFTGIFQRIRQWLMNIRKLPADIEPGSYRFNRMKKVAIEYQLFNEEFYLKNNPGIDVSGCDPFLHYMNLGWMEGRAPSSSFNISLYRQISPRFHTRTENPILHFLNTGMVDIRMRRSVRKLPSLDALLIDTVNKYKLIDETWYLDNNPDVKASGQDPLIHYIHWGYSEKRDPSPIFNRRSYRLICPYYDMDHQNPILHFVLTGIDDPVLEKRVRIMTNTNLRFPVFDFLDNNVHIHRSLTNIDELVILPSELERIISEYHLFDSNWYLEKYPDVRAAGMDPIWHYMNWGYLERRDPAPYFNSILYKLTYPDFRIREENPILHFVMSGIKDPEVEKKIRSLYISDEQKSRIIAFGLFDADWSAKVYPSPVYYGKDPFIYQHTMGWRMGRKPFESFDEAAYAAAHPDFIRGSSNPVMHMLQNLPTQRPVKQEYRSPEVNRKHLDGKTVKTDRAENSEEIEQARIFLRKKAYKPGIFRGDVYMIVSFPNNVFDPTQGWNNYVHGRIIPISAYGDHFSSVFEDWRKNVDLIDKYLSGETP
jgi:amino acid adenylation domain-containing protein